MHLLLVAAVAVVGVGAQRGPKRRPSKLPDLPGVLRSEDVFKNVTKPYVSEKCSDGLWDYVSNIESTDVILARWASAPLSLLAQLGVSLVTGKADIDEVVEFISSFHGTNLGDRDACMSLRGFTYFLISAQGPIQSSAGMCLPKKCSVKDIHSLIAPVVAPIDAIGFKVRDDRFRYHLDAVGILLIVITFILAAFVLSATLVDALRGCDLMTKGKRNPDGDAALGEGEPQTEDRKTDDGKLAVLLCFSLLRTYDAWTTRRGGTFACLDGIRVLSMLWVIFGHTILWPLTGTSYTNMLAIIPNEDSTAMMSTWSGQILPAAEFAVDTFFWLSGFLGATLMLKVAYKAARKKSFTWIPAAIIQRYIRLTPAYAYVVFMWWKVERVLGRGAQWSHQRMMYKACAKWWWTNFLYINNLVPFNNPGTCYGVAWYLPNDFQYFLLLPLLCVLHIYKGSKAVYGACFAMCLASIIFAWDIAERKKMSFATFDQTTYMQDYYYRPWTRAPPYFIGVAAAVLWRDLEAKWTAFVAKPDNKGVVEMGLVSIFPKNIIPTTTCCCHDKAPSEAPRSASVDTVDTTTAAPSPALNVAGPPDRQLQPLPTIFQPTEARILLGTALTLVALVIFGSHPFFQETPSTPKLWKNHFYLVLSKPAWAVALSVIAILAFAKQASYVATILEFPIMAPLAKLTYLAYLLHPSILDLSFKSYPDARTSYAVIWYIINFLGVAVFVTALALVLHLGLEAPLIKLEKLALRPTTKNRPTTEDLQRRRPGNADLL